MIKYIGIYLLSGIVIHIGWTILFELWINRKIGDERFGDAIDYYLTLKLRLYDKHAGVREARMAIESVFDSLGTFGMILWILLTLFIWPVALFEDIAVYSDMVDYVYTTIKEGELKKTNEP